VTTADKARAILLFDRQLYIVFSPGQLRVHLEIGGGESAYDAVGMMVQKRRDDMLRHWRVGLRLWGPRRQDRG
jgi:hypothetical protein